MLQSTSFKLGEFEGYSCLPANSICPFSSCSAEMYWTLYFAR